MKQIISAKRQRGEVASLLTIVSMVVLTVGLFVGYSINRNTATINPAPQAAAPAPSMAIPAGGVKDHNEVCFPGGDITQQVQDKFCRTRMYPALITRDTIQKADARAKQVFTDIFKATTDQSKQNPLIIPVTEKSQRTIRIYGGLCLNRNTVQERTKLTTDDVEVYISLFGVRKYYDGPDDKSQVGIISGDENFALRYKIAAAQDLPGSDNSDELFVAKSREPVCTFVEGKSDPTTDYANTNNPLLFSIQVAKASIETAIKRAENDSTLSQKYDKEKCEVYIHLRDNASAGNGNKPRDTYNIYRIDLHDIIGEDAKEICDPEETPTPELSQSPTPSTQVSTTPSPSPTPTGDDRVTPTPTVQVAQCFEQCNTRTTCGLDPFTGKRMSCYNASGLNINPPVFPTLAQEDSNAPGTKLPLCESGDSECLCLPQKCQTDPDTCTNPTDACQRTGVSITPKVPTGLTITPTIPTPTGTTPPLPAACEFDALAYVQECTSMDPKTGQCLRGSDGRFIAKPISKNVLTSNWGASNNKQIKEGRYGNNPATPFAYLQNTFVGAFDQLKLRFPYLGKLSFYELSYLDYHASVTLPTGKNPLEPGSPTDLTEAGRAKNPVLIAPLNQHPNEQYYNFETAQVRLYADLASKGYRVVPDGNEIAQCTNTLTGTSIGACDLVEFNSNRVNTYTSDTDKTTRDPRDTVAGLKVGCGQNIVYGWTLQKCNTEPADYLFVMDVSSSMSTGKDLSGELKIDAAKKAVTSFIDTVKTYSKTSRAGLIQFSSPDNTKTVQNFTSDLDSVKNAVNTKLTVKVGTCIENGLQETIRVLQANAGSNRKTYVVFLTDGLPNCPNGTPTDKSISLVEQYGTTLRGITGVTTYAIGFGDPQKEGVGADVELFNVVKLIASSENHAFSTSRDLNILDVYQKIEAELNSCARTDALYANYVSSQDINGDGVINTIDLFLIYDNYFARGQDLPEDLNGDQIVNSLDVSIIVNNMGKTVPQENNTAQKSIGDVFN